MRGVAELPAESAAKNGSKGCLRKALLRMAQRAPWTPPSRGREPLVPPPRFAVAGGGGSSYGSGGYGGDGGYGGGYGGGGDGGGSLNRLTPSRATAECASPRTSEPATPRPAAPSNPYTHTHTHTNTNTNKTAELPTASLTPRGQRRDAARARPSAPARAPRTVAQPAARAPRTRWRPTRPTAPRTRPPTRRVRLVRVRDATCPISTGRGTQRVHLVREGGGGAFMRAWYRALGGRVGTEEYCLSPMRPSRSRYLPKRLQRLTTAQTAPAVDNGSSDWRLAEGMHGKRGTKEGVGGGWGDTLSAGPPPPPSPGRAPSSAPRAALPSGA